MASEHPGGTDADALRAVDDARPSIAREGSAMLEHLAPEARLRQGLVEEYEYNRGR